MSLSSIETRAIEAMGPILGTVDRDSLIRARLNDTANWDSLAHLQLMLALEKEFGVTLHGKDIIRLVSFEAIAHFFRGIANEKGGPANEPPARRSDRKREEGGWDDILKEGVRDVGIEQGDLLVVHSFLGGLPATPKARQEVCRKVVDALWGAIGGQGTLVMPTFSSLFTDTGFFDRQETPSDTGVLTEYFRNLPGVLHTSHPFHRFSAMGRHSHEISNASCISSFGRGSAMELMHQFGGKVLLFCVDWDVCTFFHYVEERLQVPYRFFKTFSGEIHDKGTVASEEWKMYVRDLEHGVENAFSLFGRKIEATGLCRSTAAGAVSLKCIEMDSLFTFTREAIGRDSNCLVSIREGTLPFAGTRGK